MILPKMRDSRFITIRRGGLLTDADHRLLALWAAECAEHVLPLFEALQPDDYRPRSAIDAARAWASGGMKMMQARDAAGAAQEAAREVKSESEAARMAALAAGQAAVVAHVAAHELGAAAYAIRAVMEASSTKERETARIAERDWQRGRLPESICELVTLKIGRWKSKQLWQHEPMAEMPPFHRLPFIAFNGRIQSLHVRRLAYVDYFPIKSVYFYKSIADIGSSLPFRRP